MIVMCGDFIVSLQLQSESQYPFGDAIRDPKVVLNIASFLKTGEANQNIQQFAHLPREVHGEFEALRLCLKCFAFVYHPHKATKKNTFFSEPASR